MGENWTLLSELWLKVVENFGRIQTCLISWSDDWNLFVLGQGWGCDPSDDKSQQWGRF